MRIHVPVKLALVAAAAVVLASCETAARDDEGAISEAGTLNVFNLEVGDCFDDGDSGLADADELVDLTQVDAVPCSEPHDNEVYAQIPLDDGDYPAEDVLTEFATQECIGAFEGYVGSSYFASMLDFTFIFPDENAWNGGERNVVCAVFSINGQVTGSLEGEGAAYAVPGVGECATDEFAIVDCDDEHFAEVYLVTEVGYDSYPGDQVMEDESLATCTDAFGDYVGTAWEDSELDFISFYPFEDSFAYGDRLLVCAAIDVTGAPLTGSVEGSGL